MNDRLLSFSATVKTSHSWMVYLSLAITLFVAVFLFFDFGLFKSKDRGASAPKELVWIGAQENPIGWQTLPTLVAYMERRETVLDRAYFRLYEQAGSWRPRLPVPWRLRQPNHSIFEFEALSRHAPGTRFENQALKLLLQLQHDPNWYLRTRMYLWLGSFTNRADKVVPILLTGLTNNESSAECRVSLAAFGKLAAPSLYRMAKSEKGSFKPAEDALQEIDPDLYQKLRGEKSEWKAP